MSEPEAGCSPGTESRCFVRKCFSCRLSVKIGVTPANMNIFRLFGKPDFWELLLTEIGRQPFPDRLSCSKRRVLHDFISNFGSNWGPSFILPVERIINPQEGATASIAETMILQAVFSSSGVIVKGGQILSPLSILRKPMVMSPRSKQASWILELVSLSSNRTA